jgi:site-specific DNA recombinase
MRAAIYARKSTDDEANVAHQVRRGKEVVAERGWTLVDTFTDNEASAYRVREGSRPGFEAMLRAAASEGVEVIVARDSERVLRNWDDYPRLIRSGTRFLGWNEGGGQPTDWDETEGAIRVMMAHGYSKRLSKNQRLREERRVEQGLPPRGGHRHYGYSREGHAVVPEEAEILKELAARWLEGETLAALTRELNDRGVPTTRGNAWTYRTLKKCLQSPRLAGIRVHRGVEHEGDWEPILARDLHLRLVEVDSGAANRRAPERYLLTGLLECGRCGPGQILNGHMHRPGHRRYACLGCKRLGIGAEAVEDRLWNEALARVWRIDREGERRLEERLGDVEADLRDTRARLQEIEDAYWVERSVPKQTYTRAATKLRDRVASLEADARRLRDERERESGFWTSLMSLAETYEDAPTTDRRRIIERALARPVVVRPWQPTGGVVDLDRLDVEWVGA